MHLLFDGPEHGPMLILAHGAGQPMDSPFMQDVATLVAGHGIRVVRFEFPYMAARRSEGSRRAPDREPRLRESWHEAVAAVDAGTGVVIGGKSMGGRIASMAADELGVRGLVCLGYPFHPPGRPDRLRTGHLAMLRTPALILQGERDPFGGPDEVAAYDLAPSIRIEWLPDGDHSFKPRKASGYTLDQHLRTVAAHVADFVLTRFEHP